MRSEHRHHVRRATAQDARAIASIYAPYVRDACVSFEAHPPSPTEMAERMAAHAGQLTWLVAMRGDEIAGFAYASPHRARAAYRWSVEVSAYVASAHHRRGVGRTLYESLLEVLTAQGYARAFAGITLPNPASVGLHEALGFEPIGAFKGAGYKHGGWHDVGWWQRGLSTAAEGAPSEPIPLEALPRALRTRFQAT